jgi:hypothetical protein
MEEAVDILRTKLLCRISDNNTTWLNIPGHYGTGADNSSISYGYARQKKGTGTNKYIFANDDRCCLQRPVGLLEVMGAGAEVGFLSYTSTGTNLDNA